MDWVRPGILALPLYYSIQLVTISYINLQMKKKSLFVGLGLIVVLGLHPR